MNTVKVGVGHSDVSNTSLCNKSITKFKILHTFSNYIKIYNN